jgi:hypothetical protein
VWHEPIIIIIESQERCHSGKCCRSLPSLKFKVGIEVKHAAAVEEAVLVQVPNVWTETGEIR